MPRVTYGEKMTVTSTRGTSRPFDEIEGEHIYSLIRRGIADGLSDNAVAERAGVNTQTVLRYRRRHSIPNYLERSKW